MTLNEFRAWLEGFSASFADGHPSADQWAAITAKLATVEAGSALGLTDPLRSMVPDYRKGAIAAQLVGRAATPNGTRVLDAVSGRDLGPAD